MVANPDHGLYRGGITENNTVGNALFPGEAEFEDKRIILQMTGSMAETNPPKWFFQEDIEKTNLKCLLGNAIVYKIVFP